MLRQSEPARIRRHFLWAIGIGVFFLVVAPIVFAFVRPSFCPPQRNEWTAESYQYSNPAYYGTERRGHIIARKNVDANASEHGPAYKYIENALEILCGEFKLTDILIAAFTYGLVIVGWYTMASTDANTKNGQRAFLVAGPLFGVPHDGIHPWPMKHRSYADMFHGPYRMAIHNFGKTAGYTTKVEWGLCPEEEIKRFLVKGVRISDLFRKCKYWEFQKKWIKGQTYIQDIIGPTGNTPHHYRHVSIPERRDYIDWVFFGMITYKDVFRDEHDSTFSYRIIQQHSDSIGESLSDDHT